MAMFSLGKRPKPKKFGFVPRYYDKDKEELEARLAKYDRETDSAELMKTRIKSGFQYNYRGSGASYREASKKSNFRLFIIIAIMVLIAVQVLKSDALLKLLEHFLG
jgi:hypothetical protein